MLSYSGFYTIGNNQKVDPLDGAWIVALARKYAPDLDENQQMPLFQEFLRRHKREMLAGVKPSQNLHKVPTVVLVREISLALDSRATQVIARVSIADGLGRPVAGAAVAGLWSGIIGSGDTARSTDASGVATFYSARSRATGRVRFCVTSVTGGGLEYDAGTNLETCDEISK